MLSCILIFTIRRIHIFIDDYEFYPFDPFRGVHPQIIYFLETFNPFRIVSLNAGEIPLIYLLIRTSLQTGGTTSLLKKDCMNLI